MKSGLRKWSFKTVLNIENNQRFKVNAAGKQNVIIWWISWVRRTLRYQDSQKTSAIAVPTARPLIYPKIGTADNGRFWPINISDFLSIFLYSPFTLIWRNGWQTKFEWFWWRNDGYLHWFLKAGERKDIKTTSSAIAVLIARSYHMKRWAQLKEFGQ